MSNQENSFDNLDEIRAAARKFLSPENRDDLLEALKENREALKNLSPLVRMRVEVLRRVQCHHNDLEANFFEEKAALEAKYQKLYQPLYKRRCEIVNGSTEFDARYVFVNGGTKVDGVTSYSTTVEKVKGVPDFWLGAMNNNEILAEEISERDEGALKFLKDIKYSKIDDPKGFKLDFYFNTNPYFKNSVLSKVYHMIDEVDQVVEKAIGTVIVWLPGKCLTQKILKKKKRSKPAKPIAKAETGESFFNFFNPPQIPDDEDAAEEFQCQMEQDYVIGETIRDHIIPHAVSWFTGEEREAADGDDFQDLEDEIDELIRIMKTKIKPTS